MGYVRILGTIGLVAVLNGATHAAAAGSDEGLVVTKLADPDPYFVASRIDRQTRASVREDDNPALSDAMREFGRVIGRAVLLQQQNMEGKCRSLANSAMSDTERMAWAASCRYSRR